MKKPIVLIAVCALLATVFSISITILFIIDFQTPALDINLLATNKQDYYFIDIKQSKQTLRKVSNGKTEIIKHLGTNKTAASLIETKDYVYYNKDKILYRYNKQTEETTKIKENLLSFFLINDTLYLVDEAKTLFAITEHRSAKSLAFDVRRVFPMESCIVYTKNSANFYTLSLNGETKEIINLDFAPHRHAVKGTVGNKLIMSEPNIESKLHIIDATTGEDKKFLFLDNQDLACYLGNVSSFGNKIYYSFSFCTIYDEFYKNPANGTYSYDLDTGTAEKISNQFTTDSLHIADTQNVYTVRDVRLFGIIIERKLIKLKP
jgi:hypothetical protein